MPTRPLHHGCRAHHSMVSTPSSGSLANGVNSPSEVPVPRQCCSTTANPASTAGSTGTVRTIGSPYGVRTSSTGNGPPCAGR